MLPKQRLRLCIGCKKLKNTKDLYRIILKDQNENLLVLNPTKYQFGRSVYLCKNTNCIENIKNNKKYKDIYTKFYKRLRLK